MQCTLKIGPLSSKKEAAGFLLVLSIGSYITDKPWVDTKNSPEARRTNVRFSHSAANKRPVQPFVVPSFSP